MNMNKKMVGVFVCTLLIAATGVTVAGTLNYAQDTTAESSDVGVTVTSPEPWYNPAGSWVRSDKYLVGTVSPVGPGHNRYSTSFKYIHDPNWWLFDNVTEETDGRGDLVRTGHNTYDFTLFVIGFDENYSNVYFEVTSGSLVMTSYDTMEGVMSLAFYSPDQDPFGDEEPEYGCFGPYEITYDRIPVVPPPC
jgi:hypothetical protein